VGAEPRLPVGLQEHCEIAIEGGHLEVLRWLQEHGTEHFDPFVNPLTLRFSDETRYNMPRHTPHPSYQHEPPHEHEPHIPCAMTHSAVLPVTAPKLCYDMTHSTSLPSACPSSLT